MQVPDYGAAPISATFLVVRLLQLICMVCLIGMTANFVSEIVTSNVQPAKEMVGALVVTSIAALYCLVSIPFYWAVARLGLLVMAATDALLLISFIVVAVCIGKPVSYLNCYAADPSSAAVNTASAYAFTASFMANWAKDGTNLAGWAGLTKNNCLETKAIWGFSIALCILFTTSLILLPTLLVKNRRTDGKGGASYP